MPTATYSIPSSFPTDRAPTLNLARSLAQAFSEVCVRRCDAVAVRAGAQSISYAALEQRARSIARELRASHVGQGALVAILLPRGIDMIAAMLGVSYAGAAYVPLDPSFPSARVLDTLSDASPAMLITDATLRTQLGGAALPILVVSDVPLAFAGQTTIAETQQDDPAYVIYTSGSTGRPKGVMVSQRNVLRLLTQTDPWFRFNERDVWTMFHSFAFDFSVWEIWGCLLTGATLVVVPYETSRSPDEFLSLLSRERVTVLNQTPTAFGLLCQAMEKRAPQELPLDLRYVIFGGEALNLPSLRPWMERFGEEQPQLINMYGITETTVHVTYRRIIAEDTEGGADSLIGVPIPDLCIYLLDENQQKVHRGSVGEMYIGGEGVALGYLNRPDLTAERFLPNFIDNRGGRLYRSGDLARRRPDGELVYLGRADRQVKINGFRVEPGEVEAAIADFPGVQQVCVTAIEAAGGAHLLAAYFVAKDTVGHATLSAAMASRLPAHMRPTFYKQLPALPLTVNGKIDRDALPWPEVLNDVFDPIAAARPLARQIADVWAAILQVPSVGERDNFFDAGGTSLQLLALRTALQARLGREVPVLWLFEHTTPQTLAAKLSPAAPEMPSPATTDKAERQRQSFALARTRANRSAQ